MAAALDMSWLFGILPALIVIMIVVMVTLKFLQLAGLDRIIQTWLGRSKPIVQKREDYDAYLMHDLKKAAKRNRVPSRWVICQPKDDPEQPPNYYGKVKGITSHGDVVHILIRHRASLFHNLLWFPRERMSDMHSRDLVLDCTGFECYNKHYYFPTYGGNVTAQEVVRLNKIVRDHKKAMMAEMHGLVVDEEGVAQTVAGMEPPLRVLGGRAPRVLNEPEVITTSPRQGEEVLEQ